VKLTVVAQIYNEMEAGNLERFVRGIIHIADNIVIYDDGSTDGSREYLHLLQDRGLPIWMIESDENDFKNEIRHKQQMLDTAIEIGSDWIFWLDADEIVEQGRQGEIRNLMADTEVDGYAFHQINLWRSDRFYRLDNQYNDGIFVRLWRNNGRLQYHARPGLHQRPYPFGVDKVKDSDIQIIHYGFASDKNILRKYHTYKAHGQEGWALNRLVDETTLAVRRIKPEWMPPTGPDLEVFKTRIADAI
jgi:glycosyltransferase involved in cell wall biosynthesis